MEPRHRARPGCRRAPHTRKATAETPRWQGRAAPGGVGDLCMQGNTVSGTREALPLAWHACRVRTVHLRGTTVTHGCRESDRFRGPRKPSNKGGPQGPAEKGERRERAKGKVAESSRSRTPRRGSPVTGAQPRTAGIFGG